MVSYVFIGVKFVQTAAPMCRRRGTIIGVQGSGYNGRGTIIGVQGVQTAAPWCRRRGTFFGVQLPGYNDRGTIIGVQGIQAAAPWCRRRGKFFGVQLSGYKDRGTITGVQWPGYNYRGESKASNAEKDIRTGQRLEARVFLSHKFPAIYRVRADLTDSTRPGYDPDTVAQNFNIRLIQNCVSFRTLQPYHYFITNCSNTKLCESIQNDNVYNILSRSVYQNIYWKGRTPVKTTQKSSKFKMCLFQIF